MSAKVYLTAPDVARIYGLSMSHVYVLAHRKRWRRVRGKRGVLYDADQVHDTLRPETQRTA